ncbi:Hypothetical predicted protein [Lecanosticta acicola]|uniref:Uncharacterized protein n=1 Tax=Lecanosticta acicola TaxID=111012 RepID=A0AAI8YZX7_9PEZI|nr:Hypothetical predicted protein [Lecanosticta acicola]
MPSPVKPSALRKPMSKPDWTITSDEVERGCILWLGSVEETVQSQLRRTPNVEPIRNVKTNKSANAGMYEHPILVVSRPASDPSRIYFLPMTSLGNKTLDQRYQGRKAPFHKSTFVPIAPAPEHPHFVAGDSRYRKLTLVGGDEAEKATYANVRELYVMDWRDAQLYWGADPTVRKRWQLDEASIRSVCYLAGIYTGFRVEEQMTTGEERRDSAVGLHERCGSWNHSTLEFSARTSTITITSLPSPVQRPATQTPPITPFSANTTRPISPRIEQLYDESLPRQYSTPAEVGPYTDSYASNVAEERQALLPGRLSGNSDMERAWWIHGLCGFWLCR